MYISPLIHWYFGLSTYKHTRSPTPHHKLTLVPSAAVATHYLSTLLNTNEPTTHGAAAVAQPAIIAGMSCAEQQQAVCALGWLERERGTRNGHTELSNSNSRPVASSRNDDV